MEFENQPFYHDSQIQTLVKNTKQQSDIQILRLRSHIQSLFDQNNNLKKINQVLVESIENQSQIDPQNVILLEKQTKSNKQLKRIEQMCQSIIEKQQDQIQSNADNLNENRLRIALGQYSNRLQKLVEKVVRKAQTKCERQSIRSKKKIKMVQQFCANLPEALQPEVQEMSTHCQMAPILSNTHRSSRTYSSFLQTTFSQTFTNSNCKPWCKRN